MTTATDSPALDIAPETAATEHRRRLSHPWALPALLAGTAVLYL
jgi:hypothetical protein